jgi:hypothetical protein
MKQSQTDAQHHHGLTGRGHRKDESSSLSITLSPALFVAMYVSVELLKYSHGRQH